MQRGIFYTLSNNRLARKDLCEQLISAGGDIFATNSAGLTCYNLAVEMLDSDSISSNEKRKLRTILKMYSEILDIKTILGSIEMEDKLKYFVLEGLYRPQVLVNLKPENIKQVVDIKMGDAILLVEKIQEQIDEMLKKSERVSQEHDRLFQAEVKKAETMAFLNDHRNSSKTINVVSSLRKELKTTALNEIAFEDIEFTEKISSGTSGQVLRGIYKGNDVAIKVLKLDDEDAIDEFKKELSIMASIESEYVVELYGAVFKPLCIIMEVCVNGNLYSALCKNPEGITWERCISYMYDTAMGLKDLHDQNIIHRDLKSLNLLLSDTNRIKVCDFGLSREYSAELDTFKKLRGTYAYCAPEIFLGNNCTKKSDIFSMGIIFWELLRAAQTYCY